jgi:hypothetical protein
MRAWLGDIFLIVLCLASWIAIVILGTRMEALNQALKMVQEKQGILERAWQNGGY